MIPKLLHWVWLGGALPPKHFAWMASVIQLHPDWKCILWNESNLGDLGLTADGLSTWVGRGSCRFGSSQASISNLVRLHAVLRFGGVYLDTDIECLKPLDSLLGATAFAAAQDHHEGRRRFCNAVFGATKDNPWVSWQVDRAADLLGASADWGPTLMSAAPECPGFEVVPTHLFYPFLWDSPESDRKPHPESILVHHWAKSWTK